MNGPRQTLPALALGAFVALFVACGPTDDRTPAPHFASASCPLKTPADWQHFLEEKTADQTWVRTCSDRDDCAEALGGFAAHVKSDVIDVLELCQTDLEMNPRIDRCTAKLRRFLPAWQRQHVPDSYGFRMDNRAYLSAQSAPDVPVGMMNPPAALLAAFPERSKIEEAARLNGWPYLTHDSGLGGVRTFVTVVDQQRRFEQWFVINLDPSATFVENPGIVSFMSVQRKQTSGEDLAKVRLHFRDYFVSETTGSWKLELPDSLGGKCYACHVSGIRLLIPSRGAVTASAPVNGEAGYGRPDVDPDFGFKRLASLNQRLASYGLPDWNGTLDPADHGPALGEALGCTNCHDGVLRGVLSVSTSEGMLKQKIVDQLSMRAPGAGKSVPDETAMALLEREKTADPPLSVVERARLAQARAEHEGDYGALIADRFPAWNEWVLHDRCE